MAPKIITDISEISNITRVVLKRMGELGLEQKVTETRVMSDEEFDSLMTSGKKTENAEVYTGKNMVEFASSYGNIRAYTILLRQAQFSTLFPAYFHELGHFANMQMINKLGLPDYAKQAYSESLAFAFEGYAKERYNDIEKGYFRDVTSQVLIRTCLRSLSEHDELDDIHRTAYTVLYKIFAAVTPEYPEGVLTTYKEAYEALKHSSPAINPGSMQN